VDWRCIIVLEGYIVVFSDANHDNLKKKERTAVLSFVIHDKVARKLGSSSAE
jgi:hypothetical protein